MRQWIIELDRVLRGQTTDPAVLRRQGFSVPAVRMAALTILLAASYGFFMGWFSIANRTPPVWLQLVASTIKVPILFFLTLAITFPSLYVFNALVGSRLDFSALTQLLIATIAVCIAVLASFGPITAFFSVTTPSYPFMVLFNVLLFGVAGILGMVFLLQSLHRLQLSWEERPSPAKPTPTAETPAEGESAPDGTERPTGALDRIGPAYRENVLLLFRCWLVIFAVVGCQVAWVLRPFVGSPGMPFYWFRPRDSHFFAALLKTIHQFFE